MHFDDSGFIAYRVGLGADIITVRGYLNRRQLRPAWRATIRAARRSRERSWWVLWQSEAPDTCRFARRGLTARSAERKMRRDAMIYDMTGGPSLWQTWRTARADGIPKPEARRLLRTRASELAMETRT